MSADGATGQHGRDDDVVVRKADRGWVVGGENVSDLTSAIVLAERHRIRPRKAFDLLRGAARSRGQRITDIAQDVVASAANPLLRLPDELARKLPDQRPRGRSLRRGPKPAEQF